MKIAVGADHRGHAVKEKVVVLLNERNHEVIDMGTNSSKSCDYPDIAFPAARAVADGKVDLAGSCAAGLIPNSTAGGATSAGSARSVASKSRKTRTVTYPKATA